jgi:4-hydroxy-tetrahydrodipicolinate reductase
VSSSLRLAVIGARGRTGSAVVRLAGEHGLTVARALGKGDLGELAAGGFDVAIDFSTAEVVAEVAAAVASRGVPLVSGTTGLTPAGERALADASRQVGVLWEPNMSVGVHVLGALVRQALLALGDGYDVEIVETHHRRKVDAPSGTALRLAAIATESRPRALVHGREGRPGPRPPTEVGVHAVRGGDVVGDHSVHLLGDGERLELVHRATSRDVFAHGALRAARWIATKPAGRYTLADMLSQR